MGIKRRQRSPWHFGHILLKLRVHKITSGSLPENNILFLRRWRFLKGLEISPRWWQGSRKQIGYFKRFNLSETTAFVNGHSFRLRNQQYGSIFTEFCTGASNLLEFVGAGLVVDERGAIPDWKTFWSSNWKEVYDEKIARERKTA